MVCDVDELRRLGAGLRSMERPRWTDDANDHTTLFTRLDTRGTAQVIELFTTTQRPTPRFVYHELLLTDAAGHDYGPHSDGLRDALDECDDRIGAVLDVLAETGHLDETLFVLTADHGMAPQDTTLEANPTGHAGHTGVAVTVAEPMVWLRDLEITTRRAADRRTGRVTVRRLDPVAEGDRSAIAGATITVSTADHGSLVVTTDDHGRAGFPTPPDVESSSIGIEVSVPGYNARQLRLDGTNPVPGPATELYR